MPTKPGPFPFNFPKSNSMPPSALVEEVDRLAEAFVAKKGAGELAEEFKAFLGAIVAKCTFCRADMMGRTYLRAVADCPDNSCPLYSIGPPVYQIVRTNLEHQNQEEKKHGTQPEHKH